MPDTPLTAVETLAGKVTDALAEILRSSTSPETLQIQQTLLRRLAIGGDVFPSRVPPPRNITEVGGYLNLLETLNEGVIREQVLASALGVAGPNPIAGLTPTGQVLFDLIRPNDRPAGPAQASVSVQFRIRNDFAPALDGALKTLHELGAALPIHSPLNALPMATPGSTPPADLLPYLGRTLDLVPSAALLDPDADPLAVAHLVGSAELQVAARQLDAAAVNAGAVVKQNWAAFKCDGNTCSESPANRFYVPLKPILNAAGFYQKTLVAPASLAQPGTWTRWTNTTGLVVGVTTFGSELTQRFTLPEIAASSVRDALPWVWNGESFAQA